VYSDASKNTNSSRKVVLKSMDLQEMQAENQGRCQQDTEQGNSLPKMRPAHIQGKVKGKEDCEVIISSFFIFNSLNYFLWTMSQNLLRVLDVNLVANYLRAKQALGFSPDGEPRDFLEILNASK
jgi:hypothetical protein